jgi:hypothetical protein
MKIDFLELAKEQFLNLKKEILDFNREYLGSEDETDYEVDGFKFKIKVDGFWEKATFFDYIVTDEFGKEIEKGDYCF